MDIISPQKDLSLSDESDVQINQTSGNEIRTRPKPKLSRLGEVVVVDALGPRLSPGLTEVATKTVVSHSPAKVICHSPSPERGKKGRRTPEGAMPETVGIEVDRPRKIEIVHSTEKHGKHSK